VPTVSGEAAVGDVDPAVEQVERGPLLVRHRIALRRLGRPAHPDRAGMRVQPIEGVVRAERLGQREQQAGGRVVDHRAGDAERVDVAAG
jgi:hypothetical protein